MLILFFCKVLIFLLAAIPVAVVTLAAWHAARSTMLGAAERFLLASAYGTAIMLASFGVPGMLGCLSVFSVEICCLAFSVGLYWIARRVQKEGGNEESSPASENPAFPLKLRGEKFCFGLLLCGTVILSMSCFAAHLGTDTFLLWMRN